MKVLFFEEHSSSCVVYSRFSGTLFPVSMIDGENGQVTYQIEGDDDKNRIQVNFLPCGQTGDLGMGSKGQISLKLYFKVNCLRFLYQTFCVFLQIKDIKNINKMFIMLHWLCPRGGTLMCCGQSKI